MMDGPLILMLALFTVAGGFGAMAAWSIYGNAKRRTLRRQADAGRNPDRGTA